MKVQKFRAGPGFRLRAQNRRADKTRAQNLRARPGFKIPGLRKLGLFFFSTNLYKKFHFDSFLMNDG